MNFLRRYLLWILTGLGVLLLVAAAVSVARSLPPNHFTILTGREGGAYYNAALAYQKIAKEFDFDLQIVPTAGSVETLKMLEEGKGDIGFVQGGIGLEGDATKLNTLASVFYEPLWILYRKELAPADPLDTLNELQGKRIGIGEVGSGTNVLARLLLTDTGMTAENTTLLELNSNDAATQLRSGAIDAAFFVVAPSSQLIQDLLADPKLELMGLRHADAYARRHRFLTVLTVPEGTVDLVRNVPRTDVKLLSTVANLVVPSDFHPDLMRLMTIAAVRTHEPSAIFADRFEFPNVKYADLPVGTEELAYLNRIKSGESISDNYLPFWAAALYDRYLLFVVPLLLIILPLFGRSPLLYQSFMRYRINRWYKQVRGAELRVDTMPSVDIDEEIRQLRALDDKLVIELSVSHTYMPDVYNLRNNIQFVINKLERRKQRIAATMAAAATAGNGEAVAANCEAIDAGSQVNLPAR